MESLVQMRYLFDTLQPAEKTEAIKRIMIECGSQFLMTLIFNHFTQRLSHDGDDKSQIAAITKQISTIILDRESKPPRCGPTLFNDNESDTEEDPRSIENIPSVMISNIASYLNQNEWLSLMYTSRRTLIGCHSPFSLCHLKVKDGFIPPNGIGMAPSVRSLSIRLPKTMDLSDFASRNLSISRIEKLTLHDAGRWFDTKYPHHLPTTAAIRSFLERCTDCECVDIDISIHNRDHISITHFGLLVPTMPALKSTVYHFGVDGVSTMQRALVEKHATQIQALKVVLNPGSTPVSPTANLCSLRELKFMALVETLPRHVLFDWIKQSTTLRLFSIDCVKVSLIAELIICLVGQQPELHFMEFECDKRDMTQCLQQIQFGLSACKMMEKGKLYEREEMALRIKFRGNWLLFDDGEVHRFTNGFKQLADALRNCHVQYFAVQAVVNVYAWDPEVNADPVMLTDKLNDLLHKWEDEYRVATFYKPQEVQWYITICNKNNRMNGGYGAHGVFIQ